MSLRHSPHLKAPINLVSEQERAVGKLEGFWAQDLPPKTFNPVGKLLPRGFIDSGASVPILSTIYLGTRVPRSRSFQYASQGRARVLARSWF